MPQTIFSFPSIEAPHTIGFDWPSGFIEEDFTIVDDGRQHLWYTIGRALNSVLKMDAKDMKYDKMSCIHVIQCNIMYIHIDHGRSYLPLAEKRLKMTRNGQKLIQKIRISH